jgi:hypothetical protein
MLLFGISGPNGLGDDSDAASGCAAGMHWNINTGACEDNDAPAAGADTGCGPGLYWNVSKQQCLPTQSGSSNSPSWWESLVSSVAKGAVQAGSAAIQKAGAPPVIVPAAKPWYTTPVGIGGIAIGIVALVMLLRR